jgi:3-deoxy-D-manno-octulosonate 8-phosphate phosphatase (KDO 8-P phosphatase)
MKNKKDIIKRAKNIKLLACDIDGVLTNGEIILLNSGEEIKMKR